MEDQFAKTWLERINKGVDYAKKWSTKMKCDKLEEYYLGDQWEKSGSDYEPYVINYFFSSIEVQLPSLLFDEPVFHVKPKPRKGEYNFETAIQKATLRQDIINTLTSDPNIYFADQIEDAIMDHFFRFGLIEVGYEADWIENPNADKPILKSDNEIWKDEEGNVIKQPRRLPTNERVFVKRIQPNRFVVGGINYSLLKTCDWCAYWEYFRAEDLLANSKNLINLDEIKWPGGRSPDFVPKDADKNKTMISPALQSQGDLIKCWHLFDNRRKKRYLIADSPAVTLKDDIDFDRLPLFDLRMHKQRDSWYPLPPTRNWKQPQDEINETREQARNHRKRFNRKYLYNKNAFSNPEELDKLMNGGDGTWAASDLPDLANVTIPVQDANLSSSAMQELVVTKDDMNIISGTASEQRGQADRTSATQANIIDQRSQVRESKGRIKIAKWLNAIAREMLLQFEENFTTGSIFVEMVTDSAESSDVTSIWHEIKADDLRGQSGEFLDYNVKISIDSMSPVANQQDSQAFVQFLSLLNQFPEVSADPLLVRECAYRSNYRNEQVIRRAQKMAQMIYAAKISQLDAALKQTVQQSQPGQQGNAPQKAVQSAAGPILVQAQNQVGNSGVQS